MSRSRTTLDNKAPILAQLLDSCDRGLLIAMSAGVDSCTLAVAAHLLLGDRMLAVTLKAESTSAEEVEDAVAFARAHGLPHRVVEHSELADPAYVKNDGQRCFHCRKNMAIELQRIASDQGFDRIAMGVVTDDLDEHRPGIKAAREADIWFPLVEAGMTKAEVRALAQALGLEVAAKPSNACLSSRIQFGETVTAEKLRQIEAAERLVRELTGVDQVRVRHHDTVARIEVPPSDRAKVLAVADTLDAKLKALGYTFVAIDLAGYRSGSMNAVLGEDDLLPMI